LVLIPGTLAQPQQKSANITLYAYSDESGLSLGTGAPKGPQQTADVGNNLTFTLKPALGDDLQIDGAIFVTAFLHAGALVSGTLHVQVVELKSSGQEVLIPGGSIDSPVYLDIATHPFNSGVGPLQYTFQRGSSIQLQIRVNVNAPYSSSFFTPFLVWNAPSAQSSLTIPAVAPAKATTAITSNASHFGSVFSVAPDSKTDVTFTSNLTDAIGTYRFVDSTILLTASNGTVVQFQPTIAATSSYSAVYTQTMQLSQGYWDVKLRVVDVSANIYDFDTSVWLAPFFNVSFTAVDSSGRVLENASVIATLPNDGEWKGLTNASGLTVLSLPSSNVVGPLNVTVVWKNARIQPPLAVNVTQAQTIRLIVPVYDITIHLTASGLPLPNTEVWLVQGFFVVAHASTGVDGSITFTTIPAGNYTALTYLMGSEHQTPVSVAGNAIYSIDVPVPYLPWFLVLFVALVGGSTSVVVVRRRSKLYPSGFEHFNDLTMGGLPQSCFVTVAGNSGSGKSVLLESLAAEHVKQSKGAVYVINTEYPSNVRENMITLGMPITEALENKRLLFIDSYSAIGGTVSKENYSVSSHTDLTGLGMNISKCLDQLGPSTDVYFDSIMPLLTALRTDYLLNFLQSIAAKVKANEGRLCVSVGTAIDKDELVKLEEASDCVIETQLQESAKGQRRRLRIKKLRGKPYVDKWVNFQVETSKGIVFLTRNRSEASEASHNKNQS
jgi:KaiC/GvpD/RAD55 family RecA-like ATPase